MNRKHLFAIFLVLLTGTMFARAGAPYRSDANDGRFGVMGVSENPSITADSLTAFAGDTVSVPITINNASDVGAISLRLTYDPAVLTLLSMENWSPLVPGVLAGGNEGEIVIAWDDVNGFSAVQEKLVDLKFILLGDTSGITFDPLLCEIADVNENLINVSYSNGAVSEIFGYDLSGAVKYRNTAQTPLVGASVDLMQSGASLGTKITNNAGAYLFTRVLPGSYPLTVRTTAPWGGVNATDALLIRRYVVGFQAFDSLQIKAADVNRSTTVNATDALLIRRRVVSFDTTFVRGNWTFETPSITITDSAVIKNILGLCVGDVNGSNTPSVPKAAPSVNLFVEGSAETLDGRNIIIPVSVSLRDAIGAVTLMFEYPEESIDIQHVSSRMEGMLFNAHDGILTIAWDDVEGITLKEGEPLLTITASVKEGKSGDLQLKLIPEFSEFADIEANVLQSVTITMPEIGLALPTEFSLSQNFPNPFNPSTTIQYDIPANAHVRVEIFNTLGEVVDVLADAVQAPGRYSVEWNAKNFTTGVYFYRITAESGTKNFMQVKKLMLIK